MANKSGLGILGFMFGGVTFAVTLTAFLAVQSHVAGQNPVDNVQMTAQYVSMATTQ